MWVVGRPLLCFGCSSAYVLPQCLCCCPFVSRGGATSNTSRCLSQRHRNPLTRLCPVFVGHHNHSYGALWAPSYVALVSMAIVIIDIVAFCALRARQRSTDFVYGVGAVLYVALAALLTLIGLAKTNVQTVLEGVCGPWPRLRGADPRRMGMPVVRRAKSLLRSIGTRFRPKSSHSPPRWTPSGPLPQAALWSCTWEF